MNTIKLSSLTLPLVTLSIVSIPSFVEFATKPKVIDFENYLLSNGDTYVTTEGETYQVKFKH